MKTWMTRKTWSMGAKAGAVAGALMTAGVMAPAAAYATAPLQGQAAVDRYTECWKLFNDRSWDAFEKCYGPSSVSVAPGFPEAKGASQIVQRHGKDSIATFPDMTGQLQLILANGRHAVTMALLTGTFKGPLKTPTGEIPPTGKAFGQMVFHGIETGPGVVAAKEWFIQDGGTMMAQLGLSKMPARPAMTKGAASPQVIVATGSATEKANVATAKKIYALFNKHDIHMTDVFADDIVDHNQAAPQDIASKAAMTQVLQGFWGMSSNVRVNMPIVWAAGDYVVAIGTFGGKNDGEMPAMGVPKTGKTFKLDFVEITRWEGGKLKELWPFINGMQLAAQLGLLPPPNASSPAKGAAHAATPTTTTPAAKTSAPAKP